ncbi:MAG: TIGR04282 family arsenosugar biosynthesis glycosyltransferase [Pseudomonadota bacterium]
MRRRTLIIMVKEPRAGRVKTRLGRDIGMAGAAWWYRHQIARLFRRLDDPRWLTVLAVAPDRACFSRAFPARLPRIPQCGGDLGDRMARALAMATGPAVLIGSDIPGITRNHVWNAFRVLGENASVIGPAPDGGFWLVGLAQPTRAPKAMFKGVPWSARNTLEKTRPTLPQPLAEIDTLADVDTAGDL